MIAPPFTADFAQLFLPLIENKDITGSIRMDDGSDPVSEFISMYYMYRYISDKEADQDLQAKTHIHMFLALKII